jgi:hypothetical protein
MAATQQRVMLDVLSLGAAVGITAATFIFLLGIFASLTGWGAPMAGALSSMFIGFGPSIAGAVAGAVWGFFDGFVAGAMIAWLYNRFTSKRHPHTE